MEREDISDQTPGSKPRGTDEAATWSKREHFTLEQIELAFIQAKGIVSDAAKKLKIDGKPISRKTLHDWINQEPAIAEFQQNGREDLLDLAESKLITNIRKGKENSIIFALKTLGRNRGFVERIEYAEHQEQELFPDAEHEPEEEIDETDFDENEE